MHVIERAEMLTFVFVDDSVKIPKELSTELKDVLAKLLEKDPSQRIKMEELRVSIA